MLAASERGSLESAFRDPSTETSLDFYQNTRILDIAELIVRDLNNYGLCVLDDFLGEEKANHVLAEVHQLQAQGKFTDGKVMKPPRNAVRERLKQIRGDQIAWISGREPGCANIAYLIKQVDQIITQANVMENNGLLGQYSIRGRTKAMVACYPGGGSRYLKHVDNPNNDGRCITATYYLNPDWNAETDGGALRVYPQNMKRVDITPQFDRILFFWSDRRNPHSVRPAHRTRYAITLWYHDAPERARALERQGRSMRHPVMSEED